MFRSTFVAFSIACLFIATPLWGQPMATLANERYRITFNTRNFGPLDVVVNFTGNGREWIGRSAGASASVLAKMAVVPWRGDSTVVLRLETQPDGRLAGTVRVPHHEASVRLAVSSGTIVGDVADGPLAGKVTGAQWRADGAIRNYRALLGAMDAVLVQALFNPNLLRDPRYLRFRQHLDQVAAVATDDADIVFAFEAGWDRKIFSHFELQRVSRGEIVADVDADNRPAVTVRRQQNIAIVRVNTFLGDRATEQFKAAFADFAAHPPTALIVDLRATPGGSLSVRTLINGLVRAPDTLGWFVANAWWKTNANLPDPSRIASEQADSFEDPERAAGKLTSTGLLKVGIDGSVDAYAGPVFVLIDAQTASVAELAAGALKGLKRATVIGERTAGEVLSADTIALTDGFSILLPLADYFDARLGRLEGKGVEPDIAVPSERALERALKLAVARR